MGVEQMLFHAFGRVEAFAAHWAMRDAASVMHSSNVLVQVSLGAKHFAALIALKVTFFNDKVTLVVAMHPLDMQRQRSIGINMFLANVAPIRRNP